MGIKEAEFVIDIAETHSLEIGGCQLNLQSQNTQQFWSGLRKGLNTPRRYKEFL